jgi:hypothetical protein
VGHDASSCGRFVVHHEIRFVDECCGDDVVSDWNVLRCHLVLVLVLVQNSYVLFIND